MAGATAGVMAGLGATVSAAIQAGAQGLTSGPPGTLFAETRIIDGIAVESDAFFSAGKVAYPLAAGSSSGLSAAEVVGGIAGGVGGGVGRISNSLQLLGNNPVNQNYPSDYEKWFAVFATREGLVGSTTASGRIIGKSDIFVALPAREALNAKVELFYQGQTLIAPVWDVGPWNTRDPYWLSGSRPQAESGKDLFGRKTNRAGIDLSNEAFRRLGLRTNDWIYWRFTNE